MITANMNANTRQYRSYLLRIWRTDDMGWMASLQMPAASEPTGFPSLEALFLYLMHATEEATAAPLDPGNIPESEPKTTSSDSV